jgi:hypothetical protein
MSNPFFVNGAFKHNHGKTDCKDSPKGSPRIKRRRDTVVESSESIVRNSVHGNRFRNLGVQNEINDTGIRERGNSGVDGISRFGYQDDSSNER